MTTTISLDISTTITSTIQLTTTAVIKGILDLELSYTQESIASIMSTPESNRVILANKAVSTPDTAVSSTISTIRAMSTSVSTLPPQSASPSASSTATTSSVSASVSSSHTSSHGFKSGLLQNTTSGNNANIGLVIGIPIAIISVVLLVVGLYFWLRIRSQRARKSDDKLKSYYDEKYNCRISSSNDSPFKTKTTYELKPTQGYYDRYAMSSQYLGGSTAAPSTVNGPAYPNQSQLSLKEPQTGPVRNSKWNLNSPLSRWFAKKSQLSTTSSRASLSTGPFSPVLALKEFKLSQKSRHALIDEKSPILPSFPQQTYHSSSHRSNEGSFSHSLSSTESGSVTKQAVRADFTRNDVPKLQKVPEKKKHLNKPLPPIHLGQPTPKSVSSLEGLEQRVYERMIPTTPVIDKSIPENKTIYKVIINYSKNLADELTITTGEYFKILASHSDGWCLVEKVDRNGQTIVNGNEYINEGRGVIPKMCLKKVRT